MRQPCSLICENLYIKVFLSGAGTAFGDKAVIALPSDREANSATTGTDLFGEKRSIHVGIF